MLFRSPDGNVIRSAGADDDAEASQHELQGHGADPVDLTPLPPVTDKNELAHCLKTRFDTDKEALGAVYQI